MRHNGARLIGYEHLRAVLSDHGRLADVGPATFRITWNIIDAEIDCHLIRLRRLIRLSPEEMLVDWSEFFLSPRPVKAFRHHPHLLPQDRHIAGHSSDSAHCFRQPSGMGDEKYALPNLETFERMSAMSVL